MSLFEFWRRTEERLEQLRRTNQLRLSPAQVSRLLGDSEVQTELQNEGIMSLLPPVGTELFRRFTPASLEKIRERHEAEERKQQNDQVTEKAPSNDMAAGKPLPFIYGDPPPELLTTPLEELDPFYQSQKTFMVLSKDNIIHRFNCESACFLLSPFNLLRRFSIKLLLHPFSRIFMLLTILTNCCFMLIKIKSPVLSGILELIFMVIYTLDVLVKVVSRGFCLGRFTFLRDPWNWLDLLILTTGCVTKFVDLAKFSVLITIPRVLKIFTVIPGMKKTVEALLQLVKRLADVIILMAFCLSILAMIGLQLFMGNLRQKCIIWPPPLMENITAGYHDNMTWSGDFDFHSYINDPVNHYHMPGHLDALLCGNSSDSGMCPEGTVCLRDGRNPTYGYTNFDSFGWSLLSVIRLMTHDFWENLLQLVVRATGKSYATVFVVIFFPGCFFVVSLILAVVAMAMAEREEAGAAEAKQKEEEFRRIVEVLKEKEEEEEQASSRAELPEKRDSPQKKNSAAESQSNEQEQDAVKGEPSRCSFIHVFLQGDCCGCWRWIKQRCYTFIMNPCFDLGIVLCLVLNTVFMAMEHYPMTPSMEEHLSISELVFTFIFTAEMILKLVALGCSGYFKVSWHIFDFILVVGSLLELGLSDVEGFTVKFRTLRVVRLARWWPSFHMFLKMIQSSVGNVALVLLFLLFLSVVVGMQLFQRDYKDQVCRIAMDCELPRWHMHDFFHTLMVIFRVLCGEWVEILWDCMEVSGQATCLVFFMTVMVIGHLLVLVLFLNLLIKSFSLEKLSSPEEKGRNNLQTAITKSSTWILDHIWTFQGKKNHVDPDHKADKDNRKEYVALDFVTSDQPAVNGNHDNHDRAPVAEAEVEFNSPESEEEKEQRSEKLQDEENLKENTPEDCCWESCCCPFQSVDTSQGPLRIWSNFRRACLLIVQHKLFEGFIVFIILLSSTALVFEDIHLQSRPVLQKVLDTADLVFSFLFLVEMLLKWIAFGFKKYFSSFWCWLDFLILDVSLVSLLLSWMGFNTQYLRTLRTLRVPSRFQGMKVVLKVLVVTVPAMLQVLLVVLTVWLIFAILGVNLFAGKFYYCFNETSEEYFLPAVVNNKTECYSLIESNMTEIRWKNTKFNFDSVASSYVALLLLAMSHSWYDIIYASMDSRKVEDQPVYETNLYMYLYFMCFITIGCYFTFSFFIRSFISALQQQRHKTGNHVFMTEQQHKFSTSMKTLFSEPNKDVQRPQNQCHARLFDVVTAPCFEIFMGMVICLNMVALMVETYEQSWEKEVVLYWFHFILLLIFLLEFFLKIIALRRHYFSSCTNIVDFVILIVCIAGLFVADLVEKYFVSPQLFAVLRLTRILWLLRLIRFSKGIRMLIVGFVMSLPALVNIGLLLFLLVFTFSVVGMFNFAYVRKEALINDLLNFETFGNSMLSMMMVTTSSAWDGLLFPIMNTPPDCDPLKEHPGSVVVGDCGSPVVGIIFFATYINLFFLLVLYLFSAVVLETFNTRSPEDPEDLKLLSDHHLQMFYKTWRKFDPDASQLIEYSELSDFCDALQDPLRIPKPNNIKLIQMDLPLLPGDQVHYVDVLQALTAQLFGKSGQSDALRARLEEKFFTNPSKVSQEPISSTLQRKQEEVAASVIQRAYRKHLLQDAGDKETSHPAGGGATGISGATSQ
ncbi:sodium channel protein type 4 subunit alpha B-like isoform X2 [Amphiprion ocellaris]|uniref:sodium channel protein type 4 subunit alpha B-like isoform X2 n=1 Tax=Amphiprion ocellaris TaxID=80972 RepID=UPI000C302E16|nr:sodium channel protein type 4 subunit alpha B-like isoform X2 [Amphiprion ocellaris]